MVTSTPTATAHGVAHSGVFHVMTHARFLAARTIRESLRQPGVEVTNIFIPLFFLAVSTAAIGQVAGRAFGVDNYLGFQLPVAVLQAVAGSSSASGIAMVTDMERGYFDKLLLTPASRWSLIIGRVSADAVRAVFFSAVMLAAALIFGAGMHAGVGGVFVVLLMAAVFGAAYSGIGIFVAMRTANAQAAQASFLLFFPLLFMAPAFAPKEIFAPWMQAVATVNPGHLHDGRHPRTRAGRLRLCGCGQGGGRQRASHRRRARQRLGRRADALGLRLADRIRALHPHHRRPRHAQPGRLGLTELADPTRPKKALNNVIPPLCGGRCRSLPLRRQGAEGGRGPDSPASPLGPWRAASRIEHSNQSGERR